MRKSVFLMVLLLPLPGLAASPSDRSFASKLDEIRHNQAKFSEQWKSSRTEASRSRVRLAARTYVVKTITREIFPPWMGTPWHMGRDDDASVPHQKGKRVSCSQFVTAVLQNVGLRLDSRLRWAQAPALYIQRSLAPKRNDLHRFLSIPPAELSRRLARLPDGLYVIGLNCHVGFVWIDSGRVRFVHSNYVDPEEGVTDERLADSPAIHNSQPTGYWVTPLFQDDRLIEYWLVGKPVPLQRLGQ